MSMTLIVILSVLGITLGISFIFWLLTCISIVPKCDQCKSTDCEIYNSHVREAWLDCVCHACGYKWRIQ